MSRLHIIQATISEIARHFGVDPIPALAVPDETTEGLPGLVVIEKDGRRILKRLNWGWPLQTSEGRLRGDPPRPLGLGADLTKPMWKPWMQDTRYRCLIVLTHFGNPDGDEGAKTRTWFSVKDQPILAWAGFCRNTEEFDAVYAGMTREANAAIPPTNDRMPVLLEPQQYDQWLHGDIKDVIRFQFGETIAAERFAIERTDDRWRSDGRPSTAPQLAFL
jgi:putative SOS response-associated peptidase YedK